MKVFRKERWVTFDEHVEWHRKEAFCRTFGHAKAVQKGLRKPVWICPRCHHGVSPCP